MNLFVHPTATMVSWGMEFGWAYFIATFVLILLIALPLMLAVAMIIYAERKIWAAIALRRGPNVVGPWGLLQSFAELRAAMAKEFPQLGREGLIDLKWAPPKLDAAAEGPVGYPIGDFFLTNAICRASPTMQRCSEELVQGVAFREAAE